MAALAARPQLGDHRQIEHLVSLVVAPTHRRGGLGSILLAASERQTNTWECGRLELTSSRSAAPEFHPALGYEEPPYTTLATRGGSATCPTERDD